MRARPSILPAAILLVLMLFGLDGAAVSQEDCDALRGDENILPGQLLDEGGSGWQPTALPGSKDLDEALAQLDYGDEVPVVHALDLDGDGEREYILTSAGGRLCGNAGCPHVLLAGRPLTRIGEMFGHVAILDERINGHRVVQAYARYLVEATSLDTWVFDGKAYRLVSHAIVDRCGLEQWRRRMRSGG